MTTPAACGECRKQQLDRKCCRVGLADDADHISALPDDLLLQILAGLGCARAAANTSLLSRRWRGLWTRSPQLIFHTIAPDQLQAAVGQIAPPAGCLRIFIPGHHMLTPDRISSLLRAAAPLAPAELSVDIHADMKGCSDADAVDLPCLDRTVSLRLHFDPRLRLPPVGDFTALQSLSFGSCHMALGELLPRCPCLRKLRLSFWENGSITVHSPSLQALDVSAQTELRCVDIVAPVLKKLKLSAKGISHEFSLSLSASLVDDLSWDCRSCSMFGGIWRMWHLELKTLKHFVHMQQTNNRESTCLKPQHHTHGNTLLLFINAVQNDSGDMALTFEQEISRNQVRNVSVLELKIATGEHVYGAMVLDLLRLCTSVQKVKVNLYQGTKACPVNCDCDQPNNWKDQIISLTDLKEVSINGFNGEEHEVGFLKVLLRCAALLERVTMNLSRNVPRSCRAYVELASILKAHPSVKFTTYQWSGDQVLFG